jgi:hypothetical protein
VTSSSSSRWKPHAQLVAVMRDRVPERHRPTGAPQPRAGVHILRRLRPRGAGPGAGTAVAPGRQAAPPEGPRQDRHLRRRRPQSSHPVTRHPLSAPDVTHSEHQSWHGRPAGFQTTHAGAGCSTGGCSYGTRPRWAQPLLRSATTKAWHGHSWRCPTGGWSAPGTTGAFGCGMCRWSSKLEFRAQWWHWLSQLAQTPTIVISRWPMRAGRIVTLPHAVRPDSKRDPVAKAQREVVEGRHALAGE